MEHLSQKEIADYLLHQWKFKISEEEKEHYKEMEKLANQDYWEQYNECCSMKNLLQKRIHEVKYVAANQSVKPSGKFKYMSAFRFYRKEQVPLIKQQHPELEGKERQVRIKDQWRDLNDELKYVFVQMSRADRERAIYAHKLMIIKENLARKIPG